MFDPAEVGEIGKGYATITFSHIDAEYEADTDAALVRDGWATVTALASPCEAVSMDVSELTIGARSRELREPASADG